MYQQEMARSGKTLFSIRGTYIYGIIVIGTLLVWLTHSAIGPFEDPALNGIWFWVSLAVAIAGALIRVITNGYAALGTSGKAKKEAQAAELNTTGPYSLVRNPLYVGRIVNFTGIAMLTGLWSYGLLIFFLAVLVYERISVYEEEFLRSKFGEAHAAWAKDVPLLLPRLHGWTAPKYPFWWRRMIWREYKKFFQLATALVLYDLARRNFSLEIPADHLIWYYLYGVAVVLRIIAGIAHTMGAFRDLS